MAKKALINFTTGDKTFEKGHVYADEIVTSEIDTSNFEDVADEAIVPEATEENIGAEEEINLDEKNGEEFADEKADEVTPDAAPEGEAAADESGASTAEVAPEAAAPAATTRRGNK